MGGWSPGREHRRVETEALSAEKRVAQVEAGGVERNRALGTESGWCPSQERAACHDDACELELRPAA